MKKQVRSLFAAVINDDTVALKLLIRQKVDVSAVVDSARRSPLMLAAMNKMTSVEIMRILIAAKADVNFDDRCPTRLPTALFHAAATGSTEKVNILLAHKADLHISNKSSHTAVDVAKAKGHHHIVKLLLDAKALLRERWDHMHDACTDGRTAEVKALLDAGYPLYLDDYRGGGPLLRAAANGHIDVVRMLIAAGARVNFVGLFKDTALKYSVENGYPDILRLLIAAKAHVDEPESSTQESGLHCAARYDNPIAAKILIDAKANVNHKASSLTSLSYAAAEGHLDVMRVLLEARAWVDRDTPTPLMRAASAGHHSAVAALLDAAVKQYGSSI